MLKITQYRYKKTKYSSFSANGRLIQIFSASRATTQQSVIAFNPLQLFNDYLFSTMQHDWFHILSTLNDTHDEKCESSHCNHLKCESSHCNRLKLVKFVNTVISISYRIPFSKLWGWSLINYHDTVRHMIPTNNMNGLLLNYKLEQKQQDMCTL